MIPIKQSIQRKGTGLDARTWRDILVSAWQSVGVFWHTKILPKHFTREGAREYGYKPRSKNYMIRKARKFGHQEPLVWSGELHRQARMWRDVRAASSGARVVIHGPKYLYQYRKNQNDPRKAQELQMISAADAEACGNELDKAIGTMVSVKKSFMDTTRGHEAA